MNAHPTALATLVAFAVGAGCGGSCAPALARATPIERAHRADAQSVSARTGTALTRAPSGAPLTSTATQTGAGTGTGTAEQGVGETPQAEVDPLVSNGLGSPTCRGSLAGELSATNRRNCETSGFVAAPAPTGDYGIDVHIATGVLDFGSWLPSTVQDLFVTPLWMALVWAVHALVVMVEWCFTIDLLDSAAAGGVGRGLRQMQATFTEPWLPIALAAASVLALYHGIVRRRVAQTLGEALLMGAMMVGGLWIIADPTGTVGALGAWANQASLGTLAVAARGTPVSAGRALGSSLDTVFAEAIEAPWCYLEFGEVGWCREPSQLDPRLRAAGLKIAAREIAPACQHSSAPPALCASAGSVPSAALEHSAEQLRDARSNGAVFLALPANGPARNSINEQGSLLRTLCQSSEAENCRGPTAAQAEFRTVSGTLWRLGGVLAIAAGLLGMLLLLGFVVLRLLTAAIFSLLYLLVAPAMVLAPAFGEAGRTLFRRWLAQLLGAVVSKLVFSFLLGVVLAVLAILAAMTAVGWWTQWLLMSAFWWGAYTRRHHALGVAGSALGDRRSPNEHAGRRSAMRRMSELLDSRKAIAAARWAKGRRPTSAASVECRRKLARGGRELAQAGGDEQVRRTLEGERRDAHERIGDAPEILQRLAAKRAQLERVGRERSSALAAGKTRRAAELRHRGDRVKGEIEREQDTLNAARQVAREGERARRGTGDMYTRERREQQERFLDAQAAIPAGVRARDRAETRGTAAERGGRVGERRDYAALAGLAGYGRDEYERLDPRRKRETRLEIDRELALRRELNETARTLAAGGEAVQLGRRERHRASRELDGALQQRMRDGGHSMPASRRTRSGFDAWREAGRAERRSTGGPESSVLRDAREVAARRKRQLGRDRP